MVILAPPSGPSDLPHTPSLDVAGPASWWKTSPWPKALTAPKARRRRIFFSDSATAENHHPTCWKCYMLPLVTSYHCSNLFLTCNLLFKFIDGIPRIQDVRTKIVWFPQGLSGAILQAYRDMVCIVSARKIRVQVNKSRDVTNKQLGIPALFDPCHF